MRPSIAITLIVCGTLVAAMPIIAHRWGLQLADVGSLCYLALAAVMIISAIAGSMAKSGTRMAQGFNPLPVASAA